MPVLAALLTALAALQAPAISHEETSELLEFSYGWPALVEEEPVLSARLEAEMAAERAQALAWAEEDRASRSADFPFMGHHFAKHWQVAGASVRLLSLTAATDTYTGGAHGNYALEALLWDRAADESVDPAGLLGEAAMASLTERYCAALDAERERRRGEPVGPDDFFGDCPPLAEQALAPTDEDGDGRFERLDVLIPPYVAGPWVEGPYEIVLPFEAGDLAGLTADYRDSFEAD